MRRQALFFSLFLCVGLAACGSDSPVESTAVTSGTKVAVETKPVPVATAKPVATLDEIKAKVTISVFLDSGVNTYRVIARNDSNATLQETILVIQGGRESGEYHHNSDEVRSIDTSGIAYQPAFHGNVLQYNVMIDDFTPGETVSVRVAFKPGGTCVGASTTFRYETTFSGTTGPVYCNSESGISNVPPSGS